MHVQGCQETNVVRRCMEALALHTGHQKYTNKTKTSFISVVDANRVSTRVKHIYIPVYFLLEQFNNCLFTTKYEKSSVMLSHMCTKSCSV